MGGLRASYGFAVAMLAGALALGVSASSTALNLEPPRVEEEFEAGFLPSVLSRSEQTPISLRTAMRFKTSDGTPPPAVKEFELSEDRHARLNLKGVPVCPPGNVESPPPQQRCKAAEIGAGKMLVNIHFPGESPIEKNTELTVFNRGLNEGSRTFLIVGYLRVPTPAQIITTVTVKRSSPGRYKLKLVGAIPKIAGGSGSVTYLGLRFRKGVFSAICEDRHLNTRLRTLFADGTSLGSAVSRTCMPSR
jgi:hypothetical protein